MSTSKECSSSAEPEGVVWNETDLALIKQSGRPRWLIIASVLGAVAVVLALALGLGLVLGSKKKLSSDHITSNSSFLLSLNFLVTSTPTTRYYKFIISEAIGSPDGFERPMLVVNNQFPGPLIEVNSGDELVVNVVNQLSNGTTIHWHGQLQNGTNYMDGTTGITQCLIPPGTNFTYRFTINTNQYGTFWYHAHASTQYTDGIYGPLVIHSPNEPIYGQYDREALVILSGSSYQPTTLSLSVLSERFSFLDWYHDMSSGLLIQYLSAAGIDGSNDDGFNSGAEPPPDSGLINGKISGSSFDFEPNLRYRLRLINMGTLTEFMFSVDSHVLSVVEADGISLQPVNVHRIPIHVAQRYSVILTTNQTAGSYNVRAEMQSTCYKLDNPNLNTMVLATMTYGASSTIPNSQDWSDALPALCLDLNSTMIIPQIAMNPPNSTRTVLVSMSFQQTTQSDGTQTLGFMNNTSWEADTTNPTLLQMSKAGIRTTFDSNQLVVVNDNITVVDLIVNNYDDASHPFHLHGHVFWIIGEGDGSYLPGKSQLSTINPPRRDTVTLPGFGWVVIRFITDNAGLWAFHCHIGWHMASGLLMQFASLPNEIQQFQIPSYLTEQCGQQSGGLVIN